MSFVAWLFVALVSLVAGISVVLVFVHHEWLMQLRNRVTVWQWTEMLERARLERETLNDSDTARVQKLQDALQRYKRYHGKNQREELLQRLTALRVLAYGPNPASRYEALQELTGIIGALAEELQEEERPAEVELPYRHLAASVLAAIYPDSDSDDRTRHGWEFNRLKAEPPSQKQLVELLAAVVLCMTAHLDGAHARGSSLSGILYGIGTDSSEASAVAVSSSSSHRPAA